MSIFKTAKLVLAAFLIVFLVVVGFKYHFVYADEYSVLQDEKDKLNSEINLYSPAQATNKANLKALQDRVNVLKGQIEALLAQLEKKQLDINKRNSDFDQEYKKLSLAVRSYYIRSYYPSGLIIILGAQNATDAIRMLGVYSLLSKKDRDVIIGLASTLAELQKEKSQLQSQVDNVSALKKDIDAKAKFLTGEVAKVDTYIGQLQTKIAQLSARQEEILAQRLAGLNISRSAATLGRCDSDLTNGRDPGFSPKLAVFTYGVPNRVGLNQWGAYGRARNGQGYEQILKAYYNFDGYQNFDTNMQIRVDGYGSYGLEDYVKRIYEVPANWPTDALRAQAIAARSYALAYTNNGNGSICATESCQVFKPEPKGGAWEQAVNDTAGKTMVQGGKPIKAWFSSTHGGYVRTSGEVGWSDTSWTKHATDTSSGNIGSFSDLQNNSYDKDSPWFYCDWGSRSSYNKTAWLKPEETADIVNVILLARSDSSIKEHLYQTDKPNPAGTDTWNQDRVKQELRNRNITPYNNVSDFSVSSDWGAGRTTTVNVSGDAGSQSFDGGEFKNFFNLRAPANIQIVGPLFNIEKR